MRFIDLTLAVRQQILADVNYTRTVKLSMGELAVQADACGHRFTHAGNLL